MSELFDEFARQARVIEASVVVEPAIASTVGLAVSRRRRKRRVLWSGAAGAAVLASAAGLVVAGSWWSQDRVAPMAPVTESASEVTDATSRATTPTPSASASPSPSPSPSASAPAVPTLDYVDGFAPVEQWPSSEIPWDEVGPGWVLVSFVPDYETRAGLSLISPDGTWYSVRYGPVGSGFNDPSSFYGSVRDVPLAVAWDGTSAWFAELGSGTTGNRNFTLSDLRSGEDRGASPWPADYYGETAGVEQGVAVTWHGNTGGEFLHFVGPNSGVGAEGAPVAVYNLGYEFGNPASKYLPGTGHGHTIDVRGDSEPGQLMLVDTATGATTLLADLPLSGWTYSFLGWIDSTSFVLATSGGSIVGNYNEFIRVTMASPEGGAVTYAPVSVPGFDQAPFNSGVSKAVFDRGSQRLIVKGQTHAGPNRDNILSLSTLDGTHVATIPLGCANTLPFTTGDVLVSRCWDDASIGMWRLSDGSPIGRWDMGDLGGSEATGYPNP